MREIVFDTETTGLDPLSGHRVVEIGAVEVVHYIPTGRHFHAYLNPERDVPSAASTVHGLTDDFLSDKPLFSEVVGDFLEFIGDSPLVAHNASFDMKFINAEFRRVGMPAIADTRVIDTLVLARKMFPGAPASLDALCRKFEVDTSAREFHGALLDARLLAAVYLELRGGRQPELKDKDGMDNAEVNDPNTSGTKKILLKRNTDFPVRHYAAKPEEIAAHTAMVQKLKGALWLASSDLETVSAQKIEEISGSEILDEDAMDDSFSVDAA